MGRIQRLPLLTDAEVGTILRDLEEAALPDGLYLALNDRIMFDCESCGERREWFADIEDFELGDPHNLCGGSPRCCP